MVSTVVGQYSLVPLFRHGGAAIERGQHETAFFPRFRTIHDGGRALYDWYSLVSNGRWETCIDNIGAVAAS